ncbi:MAG: membrane protein insertion efficiency factor YidD [Chloroflexota bacterium]|nr:membrane protein insertion efficiency factor YidD [Chloroflexota bacterium]
MADVRRVSAWLGGLPAAAALGLIAAYKTLFSPLFTGSCRFVPSCSTYARDAVLLHGAVKGGWLALRRLARCHPLCAGGLDQVPLPTTTTAPDPRKSG